MNTREYFQEELEIAQLQTSLDALIKTQETLNELLETSSKGKLIAKGLLELNVGMLNTTALSMYNFAMEDIADFDRGVFCYSTEAIEENIIAVGKAIYKVIASIFKASKKFYVKRFGTIALRLKETTGLMEAINIEVNRMVDTRPGVKMSSAMVPIFNAKKGDLIKPDELPYLLNELSLKLNINGFNAIVMRAVSMLEVNLVEVGGEHARVTSLSKNLWDEIQNFFNLKVVSKGKIVSSAMRFEDTPLYINMRNGSSSYAKPEVSLKVSKFKKVGIVSGLSPKEAFTAVSQAAQLLAKAKDINLLDSVEGSVLATVKRLQEKSARTQSDKDAMRALSKWVAFTVGFNKTVADFQYQVANAVVAQAKASREKWIVG